MSELMRINIGNVFLCFFVKKNQPIGVPEYELSKFIPEDFKDLLPTIEEIEAELAEVTGK